MELEFISKNELNNVARAMYDLRVGMPVIIDGQYLVFACETINDETFKNLIKKDVFINVLLSNGKVALVKLPKNTNFSDLLISKKFEQEKPSRSSITSATKLLKAAELMPTYLMLYISELIPCVTAVSSQDVDTYICHVNNKISRVAEAELKLDKIKQARIISFRAEFALYDHYAIIIGNLDHVEIPSVRIHSTCFTGDLLKSLSCDCHDQLITTLEYMNNDHPGIVLYLMQEGRGIGLTNKIRAYKLQESGYDTIEANEKLGFNSDERDFSVAAAILRDLGISKINLLTNNPEKIKALQDNAIEVVRTTSISCGHNLHNEAYLKTKKAKMGHKLVNF